MSAADVNAVLVRPAVVSDAAPIMKIYGHYVKNTIFTFEETPPKSEYFADKINNTAMKIPINGDLQRRRMRLRLRRFCGALVVLIAILWNQVCMWTVLMSVWVSVKHCWTNCWSALEKRRLGRWWRLFLYLIRPVSLCMRSAALSPAACYTESGGNSARLVMSGFWLAHLK